MKKIALLLILLSIMIVPAYAESSLSTDYVMDEGDMLTGEQEEYFEAESQRIYEQYGLSFYVVTGLDYTEQEHPNIYSATEKYAEALNLDEHPGMLLYIDHASTDFDYYTSYAYANEQNYSYLISSFFETTYYYDFIVDYYILNENNIISVLNAEQSRIETYESIVIGNVMDASDILSDAQEAMLTSMTQAIAQQHQVEVYIMTIDDYNVIEDSYYIEDAGTKFYSDNDLGYGDGKDGVMLMLSMNARDFTYFIYGDKAHEFFPESTLIYIEENFLDNFANDDWYGGFYDFVSLTDEEFSATFFDHFIRSIEGTYLLAALVISFILSFSFMTSQKHKLKSINKNSGAVQYVPKGGVNIHHKEEVYSHTTTTRTRINTSSGGSGGGSSRSFSGGGFSGRSGKF